MATIAAAAAAFTCDKNYELYSFSFLVASRVEPSVRRTESNSCLSAHHKVISAALQPDVPTTFSAYLISYQSTQATMLTNKPL